MKRSLIGFLLSLGALAACNDAPPGQMEPIPRPEGYVEPPKPEAPKPTPPPAPDPNKVTLRWKLAVDSPVAFRLEGTPEAPPSKKDSKAPAAAPSPLRITYALQRPEEGDYVLRFAAEGAPLDQGTVTERGFVLDGLKIAERNLATMWLELPRDPVAIGETWGLGADLVDTAPLGPAFLQKQAERRNSVKLTAIIPEGEEKVATLEYDLHESVVGTLQPMRSHGGHGHSHGPAPATPPATTKGGKKKGAKGKPEADTHEDEGPSQITAEVSLKGRGEFLVKAGRWRTWSGTLSSKLEGYTPTAPSRTPVQAPVGTYKLRLTALDSVPAELQPAAKK